MKSKVEVFGRVSSNYKELANRVALEVVNFLGQPDMFEVAIQFVSENEIQRINNEFRGIDKVTDVLSFPALEIRAGEIVNKNSIELNFVMNENGLVQLGDMAICTKRMKQQADEFGVTAQVELKKLVIHSMLHLFGYDHIEDSDYEIMNKKERELDKKIKI